ncbi:MAG: hypothetical protein RMK18_05470 [Armatimonadota bacterium]|nr:hypothetical protein [Armatimonadota bacterium]MDW8025300.1 hypothetical protein [Armatimonadota bacterium]
MHEAKRFLSALASLCIWIAAAQLNTGETVKPHSFPFLPEFIGQTIIHPAKQH